MNPDISVIVPVYNVAKYIKRCATNLFEQTIENLEIIFVDDCSPDNSREIIESLLLQYPERKPFTKIIKNFSNRGLAAVRKIGVLESSGQYIIHCDGDDWVDKNLYAEMYQKAKEGNYDIVVSDEYLEYEDHSLKIDIKELPASGKELMRNWYRYSFGLHCHNKLVKRELYFDNAVFPWDGLNMWEDNGLFARLFYYANNISSINGPAYHYNRANINAMTAGYGIKQVTQMIEIAQNLTNFFESKEDSKEFKDTVHAFQYLARINLITDSFKNYQKFKKTFPQSKNISAKLDRNAFSERGRIRFNFVRHGLACIFIIGFKFYKSLKSIKAKFD